MAIEELKRANGNEEDNGQISLKALRPKAQDSQIKVIKPFIDKPIEAKVKDVDIKLNTKDEDIKRDTRQQPYYEGYVTVITNFVDPSTKDTPEEKMIESRDFFGGFRAYIVTEEDSEGNVEMVVDNETGMYEILRYLPGVPGKRQGALRRMIDAVQGDMTDEEEVEYNDWIDFFLGFLPGKDVKLKSEVTTGDDGKNNIKQCIVGLIRK